MDDFDLDQLSGDSIFGGLSDVTKNGTTPGGGGLQLDVVDPQTAAQAVGAGQLDPKGAISPKHSPLGMLLVIAAAVLVLNYLERR